MSPPPTWRLAPGQRLLHRCWDGECVLFNDLSGDTHLVDELALALLHLLRDAPHAVPDLAAALDPDATQAADSPGDAWLDAILADLAALHLIETTPC